MHHHNYVAHHRRTAHPVTLRLTLLCAVLAGALSLPTPASSATNAAVGALPPFAVGVMAGPESNISGVGELGLTWVKFRVTLGTDDLALVAKHINATHALGLKVMVLAAGAANRVADVTFQPTLAAGMADLARMGADAIEVWQTPNLEQGFGVGVVDPVNFAGLLRVSYNAIKQANPDTLVISGAPSATGSFGNQTRCLPTGCNDDVFLTALAAAGAARSMDCVGVTFYGSPNAPAVRRGGPTGNHPSGYFLGTVETAQRAFKRARPVCITGFGYATNDGLDAQLPAEFAWGAKVTLQKQAVWTAEAITLARRLGYVRMVMLYNWDLRGKTGEYTASTPTNEGAFYSLVRPDGACPACIPILNAIQNKPFYG